MVDTVIFDYMNPHCDLDLEDSKPIFLHDTLAHDDASSYQVWLQKVKKKIPSRWTVNGILNFSRDLDAVHNRAIQSFHKTIQLKMMCQQTKFSCKRISSSENTSESHILTIWSFTVILTLKTVNQPFRKIIWLLMMHHHTKFGSKRFNDSEGIVWTNIHWYFQILLWPWPWTHQSNFFIRYFCLW